MASWKEEPRNEAAAFILVAITNYWLKYRPKLHFGSIIQLIQAAGDQDIIQMTDAEVLAALHKLETAAEERGCAYE